jgi:lipopolysaccharide export system protein LptA
MKVIFSGEVIYVLSGGVYIKTDEYDIKGSRGTYYEGSGRVFLTDALIKSPNLTLNSKNLFYDRKANLLELKGNAYFEDNYRRISGNFIRAKGDSAWVFGKVDVLSKGRNLRILGDSAFYDGRNSYGWVKGNSRVIIPSRETLNVSSRTFVLHKDTTFGYGEVFISSPSVSARADTFMADVRGDTLRKIFLFGNVSVTWKNGKGFANYSEISFENGEVSEVILVDSSKVEYAEGGGTVEVEGWKIRAKVRGDTLKYISVEKLIKGTYR